MGSFAADLDKFARDVEARLQAVTDAATDLVLESVRDGSSLTGAPGTPVSGDSRGQTMIKEWRRLRTGTHERRVINTAFYAGWIDEGMSPSGRPYTLRSPVGGFFNVPLTVAAWQHVVNEANRRVTGTSAPSVTAVAA